MVRLPGVRGFTVFALLTDKEGLKSNIDCSSRTAGREEGSVAVHCKSTLGGGDAARLDQPEYSWSANIALLRSIWINGGLLQE